MNLLLKILNFKFYIESSDWTAFQEKQQEKDCVFFWVTLDSVGWSGVETSRTELVITWCGFVYLLRVQHDQACNNTSPYLQYIYIYNSMFFSGCYIDGYMITRISLINTLILLI